MEKREPLCTDDENEIGAATIKDNMEVPQKNKNRTITWPSNPTTGNISRNIFKVILQKYRKFLLVHLL